MIGEVTGVEFRKNKDGSNPVVMLQVIITEDDDVQSVQLYTQAGQESIPPIGSSVVVVALSESYKIGIAVDDNIEPTMGAGEKKLYSTSSGAIAAFINFLGTGVIELNGNAEFAVLYTALNTQLQGFVTSINAALATKQDSVGSPGTLSLDLSTAKSTSIKLGG